jgi:hypothetical protein
MKVAWTILLVLIAGVVWAESTNDTYIERYPSDGMGARAKKVPTKKIGDTPLLVVLPEKGTSSDAANSEASPTATNTPSRAARYISPRVGSKDFVPSRLPEPKVKTVAVPKHEGKSLPSPKVSDKVSSVPPAALSTSGIVTNRPPGAATPAP